MRPFRASAESVSLANHYPSATALLAAIPRLTGAEIAGFGNLWLSEGIPQAFLAQPMIYEAMRTWLGAELKTAARNITLIGSARIGYSMAPTKEFGRPFNSHSDLDLAVVTSEIFNALSADFEAWASDYRNGTIQPSNRHETAYWSDNAIRLPNNISRGFIDPHKVPARSRYATAAWLQNVTWKLREKLRCTDAAPKVAYASVRVYRDWSAFTRQLVVNLHSLGQVVTTHANEKVRITGDLSL